MTRNTDIPEFLFIQILYRFIVHVSKITKQMEYKSLVYNLIPYHITRDISTCYYRYSCYLTHLITFINLILKAVLCV